MTSHPLHVPKRRSVNPGAYDEFRRSSRRSDAGSSMVRNALG